MSSTAPVTASNPTTGNPTAAAATNMINGTDFMTLLVAQLKNQDPTSPMDPTQFVNQLVSFNSLETMLGMKQDLDTLSGVVTSASTPVTPAP